MAGFEGFSIQNLEIPITVFSPKQGVGGFSIEKNTSPVTFFALKIGTGGFSIEPIIKTKVNGITT